MTTRPWHVVLPDLADYSCQGRPRARLQTEVTQNSTFYSNGHGSDGNFMCRAIRTPFQGRNWQTVAGSMARAPAGGARLVTRSVRTAPVKKEKTVRVSRSQHSCCFLHVLHENLLVFPRLPRSDSRDGFVVWLPLVLFFACLLRVCVLPCWVGFLSAVSPGVCVGVCVWLCLSLLFSVHVASC